MKKCTQCNTGLLDDARFCHSCGVKVIHEVMDCSNCNTTNPTDSRFCTNCGFDFSIEKTNPHTYQAKYPINFSEASNISEQIKVYFFRFFKNKIKEEQNLNRYDEYLKKLYTSEYGKNLEMRMQHLAEESYSIHASQETAIPQKVDVLLAKSFDSQLNHFISMYCKDINEFEIPEETLAYDDARKGEIDLQTMILHFLDLNKEKETFYTDFILMPINKLKNASQAFLFPAKDEKIMLIADQTIFGSCKEGFALTEKGLYWKAHFESPQKVYFKDIRKIKKEKDWISVNGLFFNVNPSVNVKMLKLLRKLSELY